MLAHMICGFVGPSATHREGLRIGFDGIGTSLPADFHPIGTPLERVHAGVQEHDSRSVLGENNWHSFRTQALGSLPAAAWRADWRPDPIKSA